MFFNHVIICVAWWLMKFALWSFNVMKQSPVPYTSILSSAFASFICLIPPRFILIAVSFVAFLYVDVIAFVKRCLHSSFFNQYIFDVLSARVKVLFDKVTLIIFQFVLELIFFFFLVWAPWPPHRRKCRGVLELIFNFAEFDYLISFTRLIISSLNVVSSLVVTLITF